MTTQEPDPRSETDPLAGSSSTSATDSTDPQAARDEAKPAAKPRPRVSVVGVFGELLVTAGFIVLLFLGWQLWWNDMILAGSQTSAAQEQSREWHERLDPGPAPTEAPVVQDFGEPVVAAEPGKGETIANLYVPRFGADYVRTIAQGTDTSVLNSTRLGIGHYEGTQMPGEVGNFAIAAHRSAYGGGMHLINEFQLGDPIIVETADGWYTYRFSNFEYVLPTAMSVLDRVPKAPEAQAGDRIITFTSCNPLYSTDERIIAYGVFDSWQPRSAGAPASIASAVEEGQ